MTEGLKAFWLCFVPLFVAVDAIGILPMFIGLTEAIEPARVRSIIYQSAITAALVGLLHSCEPIAFQRRGILFI